MGTGAPKVYKSTGRAAGNLPLEWSLRSFCVPGWGLGKVFLCSLLESSQGHPLHSSTHRALGSLYCSCSMISPPALHPRAFVECLPTVQQAGLPRTVMQAVHCQGHLPERALEAATLCSPDHASRYRVGLPGERAPSCHFHKDAAFSCVSQGLDQKVF